MTSGGENGTSGERRFALGPWGLIALVGVFVGFVTASSVLTEIARSDAEVAWWKPVLWETTSAIVIIGMAPLVGWAMQRWRPNEEMLVRDGLIHLGLTLPFAAVHVAAIFVMRETAYWAVGERYGFFDEDGVLGTFIYEWRKDILIYATIAAVYWWFQRRADQPPAPAPGDNRIEIRDGATAAFLPPADILMLEAAGNYVTFTTAARSYLVRGTLAAWEARLSTRGFVRIHRARIVNRARIAEIKPTPAGDIEIKLDDGRTIIGSRRYRAVLETPAAQV